MSRSPIIEHLKSPKMVFLQTFYHSSGFGVAYHHPDLENFGDERVLVSQLTGVSYLMSNRIVHSFVLHNREKIHTAILKLSFRPAKHIIFPIKIFQELSHRNLNYDHWVRLFKLSEFYTETSLEIFSLVVGTFDLTPTMPYFLPDLEFFKTRLRNRFPPPAAPLKQRQVHQTIRETIKHLEALLPPEVVAFGREAERIVASTNRWDHVVNLSDKSLQFGSSQCLLIQMSAESIRHAIYLCHLLEDQDSMEKIRDFIRVLAE